VTRVSESSLEFLMPEIEAGLYSVKLYSSAGVITYQDSLKTDFRSKVNFEEVCERQLTE
jgi:hypothetical protein